MKAMIFCAGLGTRLKPITDTLPKALLPLGGKTLLQYQIEKLHNASITDIVVNVHHFPDQIINYLHKNRNFGCNIQISDERQLLLNTGGGLRKAATLLSGDEPILACNVDILSNIDIKRLIDSHNSDTAIATLVVSERKTQRYLLFDKESRMTGWTNIATGEIRPNTLQEETCKSSVRLAFSGMQVLSPDIFHLMSDFPENTPFSLIDLYVNLCDKENLKAYIPYNYSMMDVGKIDQLTEAELFAESLLER